MHQRPGESYPTLDNHKEIMVLEVGMRNEHLPDLALAFMKQLIQHKVLNGLGSEGHEYFMDFTITDDSVFDTRTAACATIERRGFEGLMLSVGGVKRAAAKILRKTASPGRA